MKKLFLLLISMLMVLSLAACGSGEKPADNPEPVVEVDPKEIDNNPHGKTEGRYLAISMPTLAAPFYVQLCDLIEDQAKAAGMQVTRESADGNVSTQITQLENFKTMGVTDLIVCPVDEEAVKETLVALRKDGMNIHSFAFEFGRDCSYYDSCTSANQKAIGEQNVANANDWIAKTFPDAADKSVKTVIVSLPNNEANIARAEGLRTIADNPKVDLLAEYEMTAEDMSQAQNFVDQMMIEHPDVQVVICHFASIAMAVDEQLQAYRNQLDVEHFAVFSCDYDDTLASKMVSSLQNESFIRATGTYNPELNLIFEVTMGQHDSELTAEKIFFFPVVSFTAEDVAAAQ
ncbi:MAG: substrate-binding domain-containing protein [Erysipelotrichaceae bacterium]|nr:substrate-binding domain-containing protein [Erysipelotrichaceae bacterium]